WFKDRDPDDDQRIIMAVQTPYTPDLAGRDPLDAMREMPNRIRAISGGWSAAEFERTYAPGKWTARQVLIHLAQTELALGTRARMALSTPNYAAQPYDQNKWITRDTGLSGPDALGALLAISRMNRVLFESLSPQDREIPFSHP